MICSRCQKRGQTWEGDPPKCGFPEGVFSSENWNCETLNVLRRVLWDNLTEERTSLAISDNQSCAVLPFNFDGRFIILSWYKDRGRTEGAWLLDQSVIKPLTLIQAEEYLLT